MATLNIGGISISAHIYGFLEPFGRFLGLDGVIMLAFIIATPANEIVIPTALVLYMNQGRMVAANEP